MIAYVPEYSETMAVEQRGNQVFANLIGNRLEERGWWFYHVPDDYEAGMTLQAKGVDVIAVPPREHPAILLELKCEQKNKYNNLFVEYLQDVHRTQPGWLLSCQSDYVVYSFCEPEPLTFVMRMDELRELMTETPEFLVWPCKLQNKRSLPSTSAGFCIPFSRLKEALKHFFEIKAETPPEVIQAAFMAIHE